MKIELPAVISSTNTQPTTTTLLESNQARVDAIITSTVAGPFYVKRGDTASSTDWTWKLIAAGQTITVENYRGKLTISPAPTAGQVNVSEGIDKLL